MSDTKFIKVADQAKLIRKEVKELMASDELIFVASDENRSHKIKIEDNADIESLREEIRAQNVMIISLSKHLGLTV